MQAADSISIVEMFSEIAVALDENRDALSGPGEIEQGHGERMSRMFAAIETALARLEPAEWNPGHYFDVAAETLPGMDGVEPRFYAAAFRRAGGVLLTYKQLGVTEFGLAIAAMASGFRDHAPGQPGAEIIAGIWEKAAAAYLDAERHGFSLPGCLQAASTATQDLALGKTQPHPFAVSASLVIRAMRDALE